jgi:hypothetical protein
MTSVRTTQMRSLLFRFFTIPFLLLHVIALALDRPAVMEGLQNCDFIAIVDQEQTYNLGDYSHFLQQFEDQPTLQMTTQRKNALSTISPQNPPLPRAVS